MQNSRSSLTSRSRPPSTVRMSRILGEVEVRYVRWVSELKSGSGEVVSRAASTDCQIARKPGGKNASQDHAPRLS